MEIPEAYCVELDEIVTPYEARYAFAGHSHKYSKFHFYCLCAHAELYGANVYTLEKKAQRPNFRRLSGHKHAPDCRYGGDVEVKRGAKKRTGAPIGEKESPLPTELIIRKFKEPVKRAKINILDANDADKEKLRSRIEEADKNRLANKTSTPHLGYVVDCFRGAEDNILKTCTLTIRGVTKKEVTKPFKDFFMKLRSFQGEQGIIYFSNIDLKRTKLYKDGSCRVAFLDKIPHQGNMLSVSTYIRKDKLQECRQKAVLMESLKALTLLDPYTGSATGYFLGIVLTPEKLPIKAEPGKYFEKFDLAIDNLDYFVIRINSSGPKK